MNNIINKQKNQETKRIESYIYFQKNNKKLNNIICTKSLATHSENQSTRSSLSRNIIKEIRNNNNMIFVRVAEHNKYNNKKCISYRHSFNFIPNEEFYKSDFFKKYFNKDKAGNLFIAATHKLYTYIKFQIQNKYSLCYKLKDKFKESYELCKEFLFKRIKKLKYIKVCDVNALDKDNKDFLIESPYYKKIYLNKIQEKILIDLRRKRRNNNEAYKDDEFITIEEFKMLKSVGNSKLFFQLCKKMEYHLIHSKRQLTLKKVIDLFKKAGFDLKFKESFIKPFFTYLTSVIHYGFSRCYQDKYEEKAERIEIAKKIKIRKEEKKYFSKEQVISFENSLEIEKKRLAEETVQLFKPESFQTTEHKPKLPPIQEEKKVEKTPVKPKYDNTYSHIKDPVIRAKILQQIENASNNKLLNSILKTS